MIIASQGTNWAISIAAIIHGQEGLGGSIFVDNDHKRATGLNLISIVFATISSLYTTAMLDYYKSWLPNFSLR
jgi:hypothetical protein